MRNETYWVSPLCIMNDAPRGLKNGIFELCGECMDLALGLCTETKLCMCMLLAWIGIRAFAWLRPSKPLWHHDDCLLNMGPCGSMKFD